VRGLLSSRSAGAERISQSDQAGRTRVDDRGADRSGRLQLAGPIESLSARRTLCRLSLFPDRQVAGDRLRPEMEIDQSRCDGPRIGPLPFGAGMAGSSGAFKAGIAMRTAAIPVFVAFGLAGGFALAQSTSDPLAQLRDCSLMERAERLKCLDRLSRSMEPPARPAPANDNW